MNALESGEPASLIIRELGLCEYAATLDRMRAFTNARDADSADELWILEHPPVFTQGQAGRPEHLVRPGNIPVIQADRGGQVTYHGPGQIVVYVLIDLRRRRLGVRALVTTLEQAMIDTLEAHGVHGFARREAPGVYVQHRFGRPRQELCKIGSLGLRIRRGCSYHGLAFNVAMDLRPFDRIDPCGYPGLRMTQLADLVSGEQLPLDVVAVGRELAERLRDRLEQRSGRCEAPSLS